MKTFLLGFTAAFLILPLSTVAYFRLGFAEVPSDASPPAWESRLMRSAVHASVRRSAAQIPVAPLGDIAEATIEGGKLYLNGCAGCHGEPGNPEQDLSHYPRVPQFAQVGTQYSDAELYWIVKHGIRMTAMSAYGPSYSERELWALASFVRRIDHLPPDTLEHIHPKKAPGGSKD
jgi:mono/diheme cytochrome c family protein